ncbi:MAG TPA: maleylacetoacetate isomerase [Polyangia bacterium]|jgi:maleylpyruvate isomerase|nr:maleylacetoacetate isomerase [Polyangia bacterium]
MKLYSYWRSSASWRVRIGLNYKGLDYEYVPVNLVREGGEQHKPEYHALNPMELVPALELDDGRLLSQSLAILEYLEETIATPPLLPRDAYLRARCRQLAELVNAGIQPLQNTGPQQRLKALGVDEVAWSRHFIAQGLAALAATAEQTAGKFLVGDTVTLADVCLVPQLYNARRFGVDLTLVPLLGRVEAACLELEAFQLAQPDRQPDAVQGK